MTLLYFLSKIKPLFEYFILLDILQIEILFLQMLFRLSFIIVIFEIVNDSLFLGMIEFYHHKLKFLFNFQFR